ncbi:TetR/AcrR family transcriptional regulator [Ectobacillus sp. sgz5001026]|uniref:TetR/AcrR family transcriptional regulator n=1 Tax=Ectobacillus sp. sgz5001026 TaxID=3242473 RepID=UPI0036D3620F
MKNGKSSEVSDNRRDAILQAAYTLFGTVGYSKASMKEIAAKAGVAQGLIGYHFGSKEKLLVDVVREWMINRGMRDASLRLQKVESPNEILLAAMNHVVEFRKENPEWFTLLVSLWVEGRQNEKLAAALTEIYKEMQVEVCEVIKRLELNLEDTQIEVLASIVQAILDGLTLQAAGSLDRNGITGIEWVLKGMGISIPT